MMHGQKNIKKLFWLFAETLILTYLVTLFK